jgi:hypothetical protein
MAAKDDHLLVPPAAREQYRQQLAQWEEKTRAIREQMEAIEAPHRKAIVQDYFEKYPPEIQAILNKPENERNPFERQMAWKARQYLDPQSHEYIADSSAVAGKIKGEARRRWQELKKQLDEFAELRPGPMPVASVMTDLGPEAPRTFLLGRGAFDNPKEEVSPGLMRILYPDPAGVSPSLARATTGRRSALARLLADPQNPLTARVMVNRLWHYHFGRGIVATTSDFGLKGDRPTHPQLLDWLASEFIQKGWSLKSLHRLILTSNTYRQSSAYRETAAKVDPENRLLWRYPRQRLEGELIRDSSLAVAGMLNPKMGGPSVFPELPAGMPTPRGGWSVNTDAQERNRRSVYVFVRRNTRYPMFDCFDMPDPHESCSRRNITTSPLQALTLLNSKLTLEWAEGLAGRVLTSAGPDQDRQIETAFRLAYGRVPDTAEKKMAKEFFSSHVRILANNGQDREPPAPLQGHPARMDPIQTAALVDLCHTLINANEFVYRN